MRFLSIHASKPDTLVRSALNRGHRRSFMSVIQRWNDSRCQCYEWKRSVFVSFVDTVELQAVGFRGTRFIFKWQDLNYMKWPHLQLTHSLQRPGGSWSKPQSELHSRELNLDASLDCRTNYRLKLILIQLAAIEIQRALWWIKRSQLGPPMRGDVGGSRDATMGAPDVPSNAVVTTHHSEEALAQMWISSHSLLPSLGRGRLAGPRNSDVRLGASQSIINCLRVTGASILQLSRA